MALWDRSYDWRAIFLWDPEKLVNTNDGRLLKISAINDLDFNLPDGTSFYCPVEKCHTLNISNEGYEPYSPILLLKHHVEVSHRELLVCPIADCPAILPHRSALQHHLEKRHDGTFPMNCALCEQVFPGLFQLNNHLILQHHLAGIVCGGERDKDPATCACGKHFRNQVDMQTHKQEMIQDLQAQFANVKIESKDEIKLHSVELYPFAERRLQPPRDSLEPMHHGKLRNTDEAVHSGRLRKYRRNRKARAGETYGRARRGSRFQGFVTGYFLVL